MKGLLEKEKEKRIRLKELGIEYEFSGYKGIVDSFMADKPAASIKKDKKKSSEGEKSKSKDKAKDEKKSKKSKK